MTRPAAETFQAFRREGEPSEGTTVPVVSVIIPTYNRAAKLPRAVESCLTQTFPGEVEVIVVDDGSTDDTPEVIERLRGRFGHRVRSIRQENSGACAARNAGLDAARGKYIQFLDSDDYLAPRKFEVQVKALEGSGRPVAISGYQNVREREGGMEPLETVANDGDLHDRFAGGYSTAIFAPLLRRSSLSPALRFTPDLPRKQDMDFLLRYFLTIGEYDYTPGVLCYWVHHGGERISDSYDAGTPVYEIFLAAWKFWRDHPEAIPRSNRWMLRKHGLRSARRLWNHGKKREARDVALKALSVPCGLRAAAGLTGLLARTVVPSRILSALRSFRPTGPEGRA